jgi:LDH2 family malate/lactate/ureidoglycolate dehydrogenase
MNVVPKTAIRVMPDAVRRFVKTAYLKAGLTDDHAGMMADTLVASDLRGVFSHGTRQTASYVWLFKEGKLNPRPEVRVVGESPTSVKVDGDGGLGYAPSFMAMRIAVEKAKASGVAVGMTSNHGHFGSAGHYTRVAVAAGCFGFAVSSHLRPFLPKDSVLEAGGASPMSFGVPAGDQPPLVLDMATSHSRIFGATLEEVFPRIPAVFFKTMGLGLVCNALGGILAGIVSQEERGPRKWEGVNQGAFFIAVDVGQLTDVETFRRQMDEFIGVVGKMRPAPGYDRADAPGGLEWEREQTWAREGIPVGPEHQKALEEVGRDLGIEMPW